MRLLLPILLAAALTAADRPTDAEWAPVAQAMAENAADALAQVEAIASRYPKWGDGQRALALVRLRAGDAKGSYGAARVALSLNGKDQAAGVLALQALSAQGRHADALKVATLQFKDDAADPGGSVAAQAAISAFQGNDSPAAQTWIGTARRRAGNQVSPAIEFVTSRLLAQNRDIDGAAAALDRALAAQPDYRDALYERGRLRLVQAVQAKEGADADRSIAGAIEDFSAALKLDRRDTPAQMGLGRALIDQGIRKIAAGKADLGNADLRQGAAQLREALAQDPDSREGHLWLGDALVRLEQWADAVPHLKQARSMGASERALPFNLALALGRSGDAAGAKRILDGIDPVGLDEILTVASNAYHLGDYASAKKQFLASLAQIEDRSRRAAIIRWVAHCERGLADALPKGDRLRDEVLDKAAKLYLDAGNDEDYESRRWYAALQAPRSPEHAFQVGKQLLKWDGFMNPPAWRLMVANYGHHITRDRGISGLMPAHGLLWGLLAILPLGLFLKSLFMPSGGGAPAPAPTSGGGARSTTRRSPPKPGATSARKPPASATTRPMPSAAPRPPTTASGKQAPPSPKTPFGG
jgi:hypothetical protein